MVSRREIFSVPTLEDRVVDAASFAVRWKAMDRAERRWLREAALGARRESDPELRPLVAAFAWRELRRLPWYAAALVVAGLVWYFGFTLLGAPEGAGNMLIIVAIFLVSWLVLARRLAGALAMNIGPPPSGAAGIGNRLRRPGRSRLMEMTEQEPVDEPQQRGGLSAAQKTLILGVVVAVTFVIGAVVAVLLMERPSEVAVFLDDGEQPTDSLRDRVPSDRRAPLPDRTLDGFADGDPVDLTAYRGQPLVLNFWASWCAPCVKEMPDFQAVAEQAGDRVAILGVNVQDAPRNAEAFATELGITYDLAGDPQGELYQEVQGFGMPTTLFVNSQGEIVWRHTGTLDADELRAVIAEQLDVEV